MQYANKDNPRLNVRSWKGNSPIRIILDPNMRLNNQTIILNDPGSVLIYNKKNNKKVREKHFIQNKSFELKDILKDILKKGVGSILVEGGAKTLNYFINENLWDEARIFVSNKRFKTGIKAPELDLNKYQKIRNNKLYNIFNNA